mmetsp:Transcript_60505/g.176890  ORF Transcript_60505/g.176890 Transcript_60505/m.176890 type:complete len:388 (-) Transcript_60505:110-1273(-)
MESCNVGVALAGQVLHLLAEQLIQLAALKKHHVVLPFSICHVTESRPQMRGLHDAWPANSWRPPHAIQHRVALADDADGVEAQDDLLQRADLRPEEATSDLSFRGIWCWRGPSLCLGSSPANTLPSSAAPLGNWLDGPLLQPRRCFVRGHSSKTSNHAVHAATGLSCDCTNSLCAIVNPGHEEPLLEDQQRRVLLGLGRGSVEERLGRLSPRSLEQDSAQLLRLPGSEALQRHLLLGCAEVWQTGRVVSCKEPPARHGRGQGHGLPDQAGGRKSARVVAQGCHLDLCGHWRSHFEWPPGAGPRRGLSLGSLQLVGRKGRAVGMRAHFLLQAPRNACCVGGKRAPRIEEDHVERYQLAVCPSEANDWHPGERQESGCVLLSSRLRGPR